ncbi:hypothetical protein [Actinacidiphila glaucinigra]|uniref:hypothetical protein n=1 Tax=Actinacidiphila glaucinigra TaxID=235986 RepID=UPI0029B02DF1|nr:hypothetical protein [Streptomyces sp. PA03-3a]
MELMLLKPVYERGIHLRRATEVEFAVLQERYDLPADDAVFPWMIESDGDSFVVSGPRDHPGACRVVHHERADASASLGVRGRGPDAS